MKILVVRFRQIGDAILSSVICNSLRKTYPDAQIDYVVYDYVASIFENHPAIDNVVVITKEERKNVFIVNDSILCSYYPNISPRTLRSSFLQKKC